MSHVHVGLWAVRAVDALLPDDLCPGCGKSLGLFEDEFCEKCDRKRLRREKDE